MSGSPGQTAWPRQLERLIQGWSHNCLQETRSTNVAVSKLLCSIKTKCLGGKFLQAAAQT